MRTIEDVKADFAVAQEDTEMVVQPGYTRVYIYKNKELREKLREEYKSMLPVNKQLAIMLHTRLCHANHTDQCGFYYEIDGIEDDWTRYTHKTYLEKADNMLKDVKLQVPNKSDEEIFELIKIILKHI